MVAGTSRVRTSAASTTIAGCRPATTAARPRSGPPPAATGPANLAPNAGNTVSFGLVGNQTGANPPPASFTLNGTVCTTTYSS